MCPDSLNISHYFLIRVFSFAVLICGGNWEQIYCISEGIKLLANISPWLKIKFKVAGNCWLLAITFRNSSSKWRSKEYLYLGPDGILYNLHIGIHKFLFQKTGNQGEDINRSMIYDNQILLKEMLYMVLKWNVLAIRLIQNWN